MTFKYSTLADLIRFNQSISTEAVSAESAVAKLEAAFHDVNGALRSIPLTLDTDNVVRQGFKERMLRRDTLVLLKAMLSLKKTLVDAISILSQSGAKALSASYKISIHDNKDHTAVHKNQRELLDVLMTLESLEIRLRALARP